MFLSTNMKRVAIAGHSFIRRLEEFLNNDKNRGCFEKERKTPFPGTLRNFFYISSEVEVRYFGEGGSRICGGKRPFQNQFKSILDFRPDVLIIQIGANDVNKVPSNVIISEILSDIKILYDASPSCASGG